MNLFTNPNKLCVLNDFDAEIVVTVDDKSVVSTTKKNKFHILF